MEDDATEFLIGLNHITIAVSNLERSFQFYTVALGFKQEAKWKSGAYLSLGDLWFVLSCDEVAPSQDYTHIAFSVNAETFSSFKVSLEVYGVQQWKENTSEGQSFYFLDPDGHKLEVHVGDLNSRLESLRSKPYEGLVLY